jgi:hypothetical protein
MANMNYHTPYYTTLYNTWKSVYWDDYEDEDEYIPMFTSNREFFKYLKENKLFGSFCNALANQYTNKKDSTYYDFATHQRQYTKKYLEPRNTAERTIQLCRQGLYGLRPQDIKRYIHITFPHAWDKETPITAKMI